MRSDSTGGPASDLVTCFRTPTGYAVRDAQLEPLVGTDTLPLPFTPDATPEEVIALVARCFPNRPVRLVTFYPSTFYPISANCDEHCS
jgi:hypothetical protein